MKIMVIIVIMTVMIICSLTKTPAAVFRLQDLPREVQYQLHLCGRPRDLKMVERKSIIIAIVLCYQVLCYVVFFLIYFFLLFTKIKELE